MTCSRISSLPSLHYPTAISFSSTNTSIFIQGLASILWISLASNKPSPFPNYLLPHIKCYRMFLNPVHQLYSMFLKGLCLLALSLRIQQLFVSQQVQSTPKYSWFLSHVDDGNILGNWWQGGCWTTLTSRMLTLKDVAIVTLLNVKDKWINGFLIRDSLKLVWDERFTCLTSWCLNDVTVLIHADMGCVIIWRHANKVILAASNISVSDLRLTGWPLVVKQLNAVASKALQSETLAVVSSGWVN